MAGLVGYNGDAPSEGSTKTIVRDVYTVTFTVGALTASFADYVNGALPWAHTTDVFTWNPITRLSGVGLFDIDCPTDGSLRGRFFGTTGGGSYVISVCRMAAP